MSDAAQNVLTAAGWQQVVQMSSDVALIADSDTTMRWVSDSATQIAGYDPRELIGASGLSFVHPDDLPAVEAFLVEALSSPGPHGRLEFRVRAKDGGWVWIEERISNLLHVPEVGGLVAYLQDVTDRRELTAAVEDSEQLYRSIVDAADEGIGVIDGTGKVVFGNRRLAELLGRDDVVGASLVDHVDADDVSLVMSRIGSTPQVSERFVVRLRHATGRLIHASVALTPFRADACGRSTTLVMVRDDSERLAYERELQHATLHDPLTGLPNRVLLHAHVSGLRHRLAPGRAAALLHLDLDRFTEINQALGVEAGDAVLTAVASRLLQACGPQDFVARVGADEFAVVAMTVTTEQQARDCCQHLLDVLALPLTVGDETLRLSASMGAALTSGTDSESASQAARLALTTAKAAGRGRIQLHDDQPQPLLLERWRLESELREAINTESLTLAYHPHVDLATGAFLGAEALARWTSPLRGPVSPDQFIPIAEGAGLIDALGRWTLNQACADATAWPNLPGGERPTVSVNISVKQLVESHLREDVVQALKRSGLRAQDLILEVTETGVLADIAGAVRALTELRDLGVRLHIDDFGTGYASMLYVRHFPVEALKIDRSFVAGLGHSTDDAAIIAATISLALSTGMTVIAEGVETQEQAELLLQAGCTRGQGYLWSRPLCQDDWLALLDTQVLAAGTRTRRRNKRPSPEATARILELHGTGASATTIAAALNAAGMPAPGANRRWHRASVATSLADFLGKGPRPGTGSAADTSRAG